MVTLTWEEYQNALLMAEAKSTQARGGRNMGDTKEREEREYVHCKSKAQRVAKEVCEVNILKGKCTRNEESQECETVEEKKSTTGKEITCPECGIPNPIGRVTCEICHKQLREATERKGGSKMDEMAKELYGMNKKLKTAMAGDDQKLAAKVRGQIKAAVAKSGGIFKIGESGLATQAKSTVPKAPKAPKVPKKMRKCPCCDGDTANYFAMGHDGRVHGILIKIGLGKLKLNEAPKGVQAMYPIWNKDKIQSMKSIAQKLEK